MININDWQLLAMGLLSILFTMFIRNFTLEYSFLTTFIVFFIMMTSVSHITGCLLNDANMMIIRDKKILVNSNKRKEK